MPWRIEKKHEWTKQKTIRVHLVDISSLIWKTIQQDDMENWGETWGNQAEDNLNPFSWYFSSSFERRNDWSIDSRKTKPRSLHGVMDELLISTWVWYNSTFLLMLIADSWCLCRERMMKSSAWSMCSFLILPLAFLFWVLRAFYNVQNANFIKWFDRSKSSDDCVSKSTWSLWNFVKMERARGSFCIPRQWQ